MFSIITLFIVKNVVGINGMKKLKKAIEQLEKDNNKIEKAQNRAKKLNQKKSIKQHLFLMKKH